MDRPVPPSAASSGVVRLKELLFDNERQTLDELQRRIDALGAADRDIVRELTAQLERLAAASRGEQERIAEQLTELSRNAGTEIKFRATVAKVLDGALRDAEAERHDELCDALSPMVVRTVRTEIRNSRDELVDALYPMTGRMVKAYVASAMKDLADSINRRLESNTLVLRLRSLTSGRSMAELAMADTQWPHLEELFLIRRGTGELVARWPETEGGANQDVVLGGILTAINEFATEAFSEDGASLRQIDVGTSTIYLRGSPVFLLAAKLTGTAPPAVEEMIDQAYLSVLEAHRSALEDHPTAGASDRKQVLTSLAGRLDDDIAAAKVENQLPPLGFKPLLIGLFVLLAPLAVWWGYDSWSDYRNAATTLTARTTIAGIEALKGYDLRLDASAHGRSLTVTGLVPTGETAVDTVRRLSVALPGVAIRDALTPIPANGIDPRPQIEQVRRDVSQTESSLSRRLSDVRATAETQVRAVAGDVSGVRSEIKGIEQALKAEVMGVQQRLTRAAARRSLLRAGGRLGEAESDLSRLSGLAADLERREVVAAALSASRTSAATVTQSAEALAGADDRGLGDIARELEAARQALAHVTAGLTTLLGVPARHAENAARPAGDSASVAEIAEDVSAASERLAVTALALVQSTAVRRAIPPPVTVAGPTPLDQLRAYILTHAIFFSNRSELRQPDRAGRTLDDVARLMRAAGVQLRVVGYTDETGGADRNSSVSQERADAVVAALVGRGVARSQLIAIGRQSLNDVSPIKGPGSPNRRVEFEIAFEGEIAQ